MRFHPHIDVRLWIATLVTDFQIKQLQFKL